MAHRKNQGPPRSFSPRPPRPDRPQPPARGSAARVSETFEATYLGHPEGTSGFLRPLGATRGQRLDLLVDWREGHGAIHGDRVQAEITGTTYDGRPKAKVVRVLARNPDPIPAHLQKQEWGWRAIPLEPRLSQIVSVPPTDLAGDGDLVSVLLDPDPGAQQIKGVVKARLGRPTDLRIENKLTAALFNLRTEFPDAVMEELAPFPTSIPEAWIQGREDLRELLTVTVDPPTAKDFDDAISLEALPDSEDGGWLLGVHIADVSHYVAEGGPLDKEALLRGTSVYFPDQCIPMLPERLSGELCSLREGVDRLTMTAWITLDEQLRVRETRLSESVIRSRRRLTYDQVKEACIDSAQARRMDMGRDVAEMLDEALRVSRSLTEKRLGRGALNLDTDETEFVFGEDGRPVDARRYAHHDAHRMIEEFMLLANEAVATFFTRRKIATIYRVHDVPDPLKLEAFKEVASAFGLLRPYDPATPEVLNAMLDKIRGGPLEAMLNTLLVRSLKKAEYSVDNIGHSGLALQDYLHFTSPIRRYPDLMVHRELRKVLQKKPLPDGLASILAVVAKQCSDTEQGATEAERENDRWKTCLLMRTRIGHRYDGRIQGFSLKAAFVRLDSPFVEVGVPLGALGGAFTVDENRTKASTAGSGVVLTIGDPVKVEITGVDEDLRRVSAWVVEAKAKDGKGKPVTFVPSLAAPAHLREADFVEPAPPRGRPPKSVRQAAVPDPKGRPGGSRPYVRPGRPGGAPARSKPPKGSVRGPARRKKG
ncbi:ribonuclease R family protein [Mesoterricola silvestris]|uniref:Ribonuclease R n=1 Tax=Mesoterricola silvestris TaxID=2927979 RepID=A0AA48GJC5_9BACT|nr:VacB/RNase II family 3'-5' exoribonuclease [Mesoterricola silvestris]BDU72189.1 ribonuclease R [Mesoterricola silvestris]